jgi:hypothetical protein
MKTTLQLMTTLKKLQSIFNINPDDIEDEDLIKNSNERVYCKNSDIGSFVAAPLYQQTTQWLKEKYKIFIDVVTNVTLEPRHCLYIKKIS